MLSGGLSSNWTLGAAIMRSTTLLLLAVVVVSSSDVVARCRATSVNLVEIVVNSCELVTTFRSQALPLDRRGALVTAQVFAESEVSNRGPYYGMNPDEWNIVRHAAPLTRMYYFPSSKEDPCTELTNRAPLLMAETRACCDTGPTHPVCVEDWPVLMYMNEELISLGASSGGV